MHDGLESYKAEVQSNEIILHLSSSSTGPILPSPKILGHGYLLDENKEAPELWLWPFIVTETARSFKDRDLEIVPAEEYIPFEESSYKSLLEPLMRTLHRKMTDCFLWTLMFAG